MFTLQVLDRGQTFLCPLDRRLFRIGSAPEAELRLAEAGVAPEHARVDVRDDVVVLTALGDAQVTVNGRQVSQSLLELGDRVEIGRAVLVLGRSVTRQATADDVLADARSSGRSRAERPRTRGHAGRWLALAGAAGLLVWVLSMAMGGDPGGRPPTDIADNLRRAGRFEAARAELVRLRDAWAGGDPQRLAALEQEHELVAAVEAAVAARTERVLTESASVGYAELNLGLQQEEKGGGPLPAREAARIVRASLSDLLRGRPVPVPAGPAGPAEGVPAAPAAEPEVATAEPQPPATEPAPSVPTIDVAPLLAEARQLAADGLHGPALELLTAAQAQAEAASAGALQAELVELRQRARETCDAALERVAQAERSDGPAAALAMLEQQAPRLPQTGEFAVIAERLTALRQRAAAAAAAPQPAQRPAAASPAREVPDAVRTATLAGLRGLLEQVRDGEANGDFAGVGSLLLQGAAMVEERDPQYAHRLRQKAADFALLAQLHHAVGTALAAGRRLPVQLRGRSAEVVGVDGPRLLASTVEGDRPVTWLDLDPAGLGALSREARLAGDALIGLGVLAYRLGDPAVAEDLLAQAVRGDAKLKEAVDGALARGRGEPGRGGYVLEKDGFVAANTVAARQSAPKVQTRIKAALRESADKRAALVEELLAHGPSGLEALVLAFQREFHAQVDRVQKLPLRKQVEKFAEQRARLDEARKFALDLIYDEQKYFYPYKPPAVTADKAAEYARVQADVDRRVAALRTVWEDDRLKLQVPGSLADELDRVEWLAQVLRDLGELDADALAELTWARTLVPGERLTLQTFCKDMGELAERRQWQQIEAFNRSAIPILSAAEREQFTITNAYRAMFRHRPLAVNPKLHAAARGHAREMSKLGYFSHFSPTPGRKTPYDRMRLEGYTAGASENIALNGSAAGAHDAWLHSSGHHRNLLHPSHTEFGMGNDGRYWVQNFGGGREYEQDPRFGDGR